jgi:hypothetical protein
VDQTQVTFVTEALTNFPSRRDVLRGLTGVGLGLGMLHIPAMSDAKKKRRRKHKKRKPKVTPNSYGCLEVDDPCKSAEQCCSGVCEGKQGKKRCRAHDTGTCDQDLPGLCSPTPTIAPCNNSATCFCMITTANSSFCAQLGVARCTGCRKDADCVTQGLPPGSACLPTTGFLCATDCPETGMVCLPPCGVEIPEM